MGRLDRRGRPVTHLLATLQELDHLSGGFVSLTEALDLTTPACRAMATLLAMFAANNAFTQFTANLACRSNVIFPIRASTSQPQMSCEASH